MVKLVLTPDYFSLLVAIRPTESTSSRYLFAIKANS